MITVSFIFAQQREVTFCHVLSFIKKKTDLGSIKFYGQVLLLKGFTIARSVTIIMFIYFLDTKYSIHPDVSLD